MTVEQVAEGRKSEPVKTQVPCVAPGQDQEDPDEGIDRVHPSRAREHVDEVEDHPADRGDRGEQPQDEKDSDEEFGDGYAKTARWPEAEKKRQNPVIPIRKPWAGMGDGKHRFC